MGRSNAARRRVMARFYRGTGINPTDTSLLDNSRAIHITPRPVISRAVNRVLLEKSGKKCSICGLERDKYGFSLILEKDHIKARADGGPDTIDNLRIVCVACHEHVNTDRVSLYGYSPRTYRERALLILALAGDYGELSVRAYNRLRTTSRKDEKFRTLVNKYLLEIWKCDAERFEISHSEPDTITPPGTLVMHNTSMEAPSV